MGEAKRRKSILGDAYGQPVSSVFPKSTNWTSNDWAIYLAGADWKARQQLGPGALVFLEDDELLLKYLYLDTDSLLDLTLSQSDEFVAGLKQRLTSCEIVRVEEPEAAGIEESELDEMWNYVSSKKNPRWLRPSTS